MKKTIRSLAGLIVLSVVFMVCASQGGGSENMNGIWKMSSAKYIHLDLSSSFIPTIKTFPLSSAFANPLTGFNEETYLEINNNKFSVYTHAGKEGDNGTVYFRIALNAQCSTNTCFVKDSGSELSGSSASIVYSIKNGQLTTTWVTSENGGQQTQRPSVTTIEITYARYQGTFPPSNWPKDLVDLNTLLSDLGK